MVKIYCGSKQNLPETYDTRGTRYECLRKGIGVGMHLPPDRRAPTGPRSPIRKYCGNKEQLPEGYHDFATPYECLRKGVGVGLHKRPHEEKRDVDNEEPPPPPPPPSPESPSSPSPESQIFQVEVLSPLPNPLPSGIRIDQPVEMEVDIGRACIIM